MPVSPSLGTAPWAMAARAPRALFEAWEAVFSHDPASEEAAAALMGTYASEGQRQLAVRTYDRCRAGLQELGFEPSPALERAYLGRKTCGQRLGVDRLQ